MCVLWWEVYIRLVCMVNFYNRSTMYVYLVFFVYFMFYMRMSSIVNLIGFHSCYRITLNSTNVLSHSEYHLGVCVSPVKDTTLDESCFAVKRIRRNSDVAVEDLCIGRGLLSQLIDHRGQSC